MKKSEMLKKIAESNKRINRFADQVSVAIEEEVEEILEAAEETVKDAVPEVQWEEAFDMLEEKLADEGIEAEFKPFESEEEEKEASVKVNKIAARIKKAEEEKLDKEELEEIIDDVVEAIVDEVEDVLKDAEEVLDKESSNFGLNTIVAANKSKTIVEKLMYDKGVHTRFIKNRKR